MKEFFFKLFRLEWEPDICAGCETLRSLLENERRDKNRLMDSILNKDEIEHAPYPIEEKEELKPVAGRYTPFSVIRQRLERQSRNEAEAIQQNERTRAQNNVILAKGNKTLEELETELGVVDEEPVQQEDGFSGERRSQGEKEEGFA